MSSTKFCVCACFYEQNYFIGGVGHVTFVNKNDFLHKYTKVLEEKGFTHEKLEMTLKQLEDEKNRRQLLWSSALKRSKFIRKNYQPIHKDIYQLQEKFLAPEFLDLVSFCQTPDANKNSLILKVTQLKAEDVFSFPVFTEDFCRSFIEELCHFEQSDMPKGRPNTMNNYGILLGELGFDEGFITPLRERYLSPLARLLYPEWFGEGLDSHKAFVVSYKLGQDVDLSYHFDNAEVTLNVCLGRNFEEGSLYFGAMKSSSQPDNSSEAFTECGHTVTWGVLHRGQHLHGAMPITSGDRYNLIIWMRSSSVRNRLCPMCGGPPQLVSVPGMGDGFKEESVNMCNMY